MNPVGDCLVKATNPSPRVVIAIIVLVVCLLLGLLPLGASAQTEPAQYFPETGHTVRGEFLDFFNQQGGLRIFGYPITEQFIWNGRMVQYFQHARMELHPENQPPDRVQLGPVGEELGKRTDPKPSQGPNSFVQRYFAESGHSVAYAFLSFFDSNGGVGVFGYPLTDFALENGRIVQYFQRARFDWYPELPEQPVQLGDLGSIHFDQLASQGRLDPALKQPVPAPGTIGSVPLSLKISATTRSVIMSQRDPQTLYVFVTDQKNAPVKDVQVSFTVRDSSSAQTFSMPPTASNGFTSLDFDISAFRPAQTVIVDVTVISNSLQAQDQTSFFTWY